MERFLERALPGESECARRLRKQILDFVASPSSKSVLLTGPIGAGKSTLARLIAMLKRVAHLDPTKVQAMLDAALRTNRADRINTLYMTTWYVELALTGLVESLAETQLFGSVKGGYTGAVDRAGIFELALTGRISRNDPSIDAQVTGGIVFLDEIGDLSESLQAKLLPVFSGGSFYRIGAEGKPQHELQFHGVTITASWKSIDRRLRPDLLSRISSTVIHVPGIDDRAEDFDLLFSNVEDSVLSNLKRDIDRLLLEPTVARSYWVERLANLRPLESRIRRRLASVKWGEFGNLRGLTAAVEQLIGTNRDPDEIVRGLKTIGEHQDSEATEVENLFARLMKRPASSEGVAAHCRALELEARRALRDDLLETPGKLSQLAKSLQVDESSLRVQLRQLDRERKRQSGERLR
jgi:transcriptional regulator with AAA-type ATPase domain